MNRLSEALKTVLNGLAMQYEGELLTTEEKQTNLQRVLAQIEREKQQPAPIKPVPTLVSTPDVALHAK